MEPQDFFTRLAKPFPLAVGGGCAAFAIILGAPLLVIGGLVLWVGAAVLDAKLSPASRRPKTKLAWDDWEKRAGGYPPGIIGPVRAIIADGREVEALGARVDVADAQIRSDLTDLMRDVLWVGEQSSSLGAYLDSFDAKAVARRADHAGPGAERDALVEQLDVFDRLQGQYLELIKRLETLQAQLGAVKANMIQASLTQRAGEATDVGSEMVRLKETAHAISQSYAELGGDFDSFFEREMAESASDAPADRVLDAEVNRSDGGTRSSGRTG